MSAKSDWQFILNENNLTTSKQTFSISLFTDAFIDESKGKNVAKECNGQDIAYEENSGLLVHDNSPVFAYIRRGQGKVYTVHFVYCKALKDNPKGKFYCTTNYHDGFEVDVEDDKGNLINTVHKMLEPCTYCIAKYFGTKDSKESDEVKKTFSYDLISKEAKSILSNHVWINRWYEKAGLSWQDISLKERKKANWTCQKCKIFVGEEYKHYLHTHHVNHDRNFNHSINLSVLCIQCHHEEEGHDFTNTPTYQQFKKAVKDGRFVYLNERA